MTYQEIQNIPEVAVYKPQFEAAGLDYNASVEKAVNEAYSRQYVASNPDQSEIITFVINFLVKMISDNVKPKRRGWQIFWNVVTLGLPLLFKKKS